MSAVVAQTQDDAFVDELAYRLAAFENDPEGFVDWAFPWGEVDTQLEHEEGPDVWQRGLLGRIGKQLRAGGDSGALILEAIRSGHGVGKSAMTSWLTIWALTTRKFTRGVVTAMSDTQLRTKTWAEVAKWYALFIGKDFFEFQATALLPDGVEPEESRGWRIDCVPWSVHNTSAFAGLHNKGVRLLLLFDEASEIHDQIWEIARGALTDANTQIMWIVFGNPTQTTGEFFQCFSTRTREWHGTTVDSRNSRFSNKALIATWIETYGEDSDFVRVRVRGLPPRSGISNFISVDAVQAARRRNLAARDYLQYPKRMAVDPARFGDDQSVVTVRQGPKVWPQWKYSGLDGPDLSSRIVTEIWPHHMDITGCAVDAIGIGASCADALARVKRNDAKFPVLEVNVAMPAWLDDEYSNLRAELWGRMRTGLDQAQLPDDDELEQHLTCVKYGFDGKSRVQLESKQDIKRRGDPSPDCGDSLSMTYYEDTIVKAVAVRARVIPRKAPRVVLWRGQQVS
jgi:hypothetical protein